MKPEHPSHLQPEPTDTSVALERRLRANTRGEVLFDMASRGRYATDASIYQVMPVGVFVPTDDADVRSAIQIARDLKVPVLPRGAGTSQCGQTVGACLVIDGSKHLRNVLALDVERRTARVQPGASLVDVGKEIDVRFANSPWETRSARLRFVAAITRTFACPDAPCEPTDWTSPVSRKRRRSACMRRLISPTSSRNSVPRCAICNKPGLSR